MSRFNLYSKGGNRGSRFGGSKAPKAPVSVAEEYNMRIEDVSRQGNAGIARIQGFIIFVNNIRPGDKVRVKIPRMGNRYAIAEVLSKIIGKMDSKQEMGTGEI